MGVGRLSGDCGHAVWNVWECCLDDVERLYGGFRNVVGMVWEGCPKGKVRMSGKAV